MSALTFGVSAETSASQVTSQATVSSDESCFITVSATFQLDEPVDKLTFPVPVSASNITLNGSRVGSSLTNEARLVDLSGITGNMAGSFTATISYQLDDVIEVNDNGFLELRLPLLSGFAYPVEKLGFTVTMPGEFSYKPAFSSGYHQSNIEQDLIFSYSGNTVTGTSSKELKDRETLTMTLLVSEAMFPQAVIQLQDLDAFYLGMIISGVLALLYWLLFLRNAPPRFITVPTPPEGYSAGQMGSLISLHGTDLTAMVFTWAQLGYLTIQTGRTDRVLLHKRMEMGNERSLFEQRCFQQVFGSRTTVDTSSSRYTALFQKMAAKPAYIQGLVHPRAGSKYVFRFLVALVGMFCGICLGLTLSAEAAVQWLPAVLLAAFCFAAGWCIQLWADSLFSQHKGKLIFSILLCAIWLGLSIFAQTVQLDVWIILAQILSGLMATFGTRRTEAGRQLMSEVLGFRRYLRSIPRVQLQHICRQNPDYFHSLAPYAMALGCDKAFAKRFGRDKMPPCPYLIGVPQVPMTAPQWSKLFRRTARAMESRLRQMPMERLTAFFRSLTR